ncbi:hypothetical protein [Caminicella sporogenes]|nr:hypothetical protein [Caminicella sporogenes]WIF95045.1 hypothetical protein QNI18_12405 [Caminicella sporogenes]
MDRPDFIKLTTYENQKRKPILSICLLLAVVPFLIHFLLKK